MLSDAQYRLVLFPDEPGEGEHPKPDNRRVGREDLAVVLWDVAGLYDHGRFVLGQAGRFKPSLGGVVKYYGAHGSELAAEGSLFGVRRVGWRLGSLYKQVVAGLLKAEVVVSGAVAGGDADPGSFGVRAEVRGANDLDVVAALETRRELALVELLGAELYRVALEAVGEVGRGGRGGEGKDHNYKEAHQEPGVARNPGPKPRFFIMVVRKGLVA